MHTNEHNNCLVRWQGTLGFRRFGIGIRQRCSLAGLTMYKHGVGGYASSGLVSFLLLSLSNAMMIISLLLGYC